jgi:hypothetical protein
MAHVPGRQLLPHERTCDNLVKFLAALAAAALDPLFSLGKAAKSAAPKEIKTRTLENGD